MCSHSFGDCIVRIRIDGIIGAVVVIVVEGAEGGEAIVVVHSVTAAAVGEGG